MFYNSTIIPDKYILEGFDKELNKNTDRELNIKKGISLIRGLLPRLLFDDIISAINQNDKLWKCLSAHLDIII